MKKMKKLLVVLAALVMTLCAPVQAARCPLHTAGCPSQAAQAAQAAQTAGQSAQAAGRYCFRVAPLGENVRNVWKICVPSQANSKPDPSDADNNQTGANNKQSGANARQPEANHNPTDAGANETGANSEQASTDTNKGNIHAYEAEVIRLVNEIRVQNGLKALTTDAELCRGARAKSQDMADNRYFDHNSPVYGTPFQMMKSFGITYRTAGENIAYGYAAPRTVMDGWMNSSGHRANILNAAYTRIGVGYVANGNYWTQWFAG